MDPFAQPVDESFLGPAERWARHWRLTARQLPDRARPEERAAITLAVRQGFVLSRGQCRDAGMTSAQVRSLVARRLWWVPRRGIVAVLPPPLPTGERDADFRAARRRAAVEAAAAALARPAALVAYESAAVLDGLPVLVVPDVPRLIVPGESGGARANGLLRERPVERVERASWFGVGRTATADTVVDIARHDRAGGLVAADAALHEGLTTSEQLAAALDRAAGVPGARTARFVLGFAEALAESPLESLTRLLIHDAGLPAPEPQVKFVDPEDGWWARVDLFWPQQRLALECDGRVKNTEAERWREKRRDRRLRRLGCRVERVVWDDVVNQPARTARQIAEWLASPSV